MKKLHLTLLALGLLPILGCSQNSSTLAEKNTATYTSEAALPKNWPTPGPYNLVTKKNYPAYRAAFTDGKGTTRSFFTLFKHIKSQEIPMTSPVEMKMDSSGNNMEMTEMGFLYQDQTIGKTGANGKKVTVKDIPATTVLSYAWMGKRTDEAISTARTAITAQLEKENLTASSFRLLGYNSPSLKAAKRTHELQAIIQK